MTKSDFRQKVLKLGNSSKKCHFWVNSPKNVSFSTNFPTLSQNVRSLMAMEAMRYLHISGATHLEIVINDD